MTHQIASIASAASLLWMSFTLWRLWVRPASNDDAISWVRFGVGLMLLEFFLLHSGALVGVVIGAASTAVTRSLVFAAFALFYGLFVVGLARGTDTRAVLQVYGFVMLSRFISVIVFADHDASILMLRSFVGILVYLPMVAVASLLPLPRLGISTQLAGAARTPNSRGLWIDEPHRPIAAGAIYFLIMGLLELKIAFSDGRSADPIGLP